MTNYWLMKTEPEVYSIDDLKRDGFTPWSGVRNYQARNYMRDSMKVGDLVLFYHSSTEPAGVAGIGRISRTAYPDATALESNSEYYDPKASPQNPIWFNVDVAFVKKFRHFVSLDEIRALPALKDMLVLKRGMRLSIQPVEAIHFKRIESLGLP
jgi:predicted RNA-binding protein with PUA-like domain